MILNCFCFSKRRDASEILAQLGNNSGHYNPIVSSINSDTKPDVAVIPQSANPLTPYQPMEIPLDIKPDIGILAYGSPVESKDIKIEPSNIKKHKPKDRVKKGMFDVSF